VNTLRFDADGIFGDNTDGIGLVNDIQQRLGFAIGGKRVLILGAGGAAQGSVLPVAERAPPGSSSSTAPRPGPRLREQFAGVAAVDVEPGDGLAGQRFDLVINATSAGLHGESLPLPAGIFAPGALAYDMVYGNTETPFMAAARALGASRVSDGLGMLVGQAAESFFVARGAPRHRAGAADAAGRLSTGRHFSRGLQPGAASRPWTHPLSSSPSRRSS
jgi:shikimate dehydrogenase